MNSILLRDHEVYGILHGNVRRIRRPINISTFQISSTPGYKYIFRDKRSLWNDFTEFRLVTSDFCPYVYGACLVAKEPWATSQCADTTTPKWPYQGYPVWYRADGAVRYTGATDGGPDFMSRGKWYAAIGMPLTAARFAVRVASVRVQAWSDATEDDAIAEGYDTVIPWFQPGKQKPPDEDPQQVGYPSGSFALRNLTAAYEYYQGDTAKPWCWIVDVEPLHLYPQAYGMASRQKVTTT